MFVRTSGEAQGLNEGGIFVENLATYEWSSGPLESSVCAIHCCLKDLGEIWQFLNLNFLSGPLSIESSQLCFLVSNFGYWLSRRKEESPDVAGVDHEEILSLRHLGICRRLFHSVLGDSFLPLLISLNTKSFRKLLPRLLPFSRV